MYYAKPTGVPTLSSIYEKLACILSCADKGLNVGKVKVVFSAQLGPNPSIDWALPIAARDGMQAGGASSLLPEKPTADLDHTFIERILK